MLASYENRCEMQEREFRKCERIKTILDKRKERRTNKRMREHAEKIECVERSFAMDLSGGDV